jgi:hypothetical protein
MPKLTTESGRRSAIKGLGAAAILPMLLGATCEAKSAPEIGRNVVYELRVYHCSPGKLPALLERFRKHEMKIFASVGLHVLAVWTPTDPPASTDTLVYLLRHASREEAAAAWKRFSNDPEWLVVARHDITFLKLADFSPAL